MHLRAAEADGYAVCFCDQHHLGAGAEAAADVVHRDAAMTVEGCVQGMQGGRVLRDGGADKEGHGSALLSAGCSHNSMQGGNLQARAVCLP